MPESAYKRRAEAAAREHRGPGKRRAVAHRDHGVDSEVSGDDAEARASLLLPGMLLRDATRLGLGGGAKPMVI